MRQFSAAFQLVKQLIDEKRENEINTEEQSEEKELDEA